MPKSSGEYILVSIGYTINPMIWAIMLADSNLLKFFIPAERKFGNIFILLGENANEICLIMR